ncbi:MAG: hypothetical protein WC115_08615 [Sphaerochaeta sp.]
MELTSGSPAFSNGHFAASSAAAANASGSHLNVFACRWQAFAPASFSCFSCFLSRVFSWRLYICSLNTRTHRWATPP